MHKKILLFALLMQLCIRTPLHACDICATYVAVAGRETAGRTTISLYQMYSRYDRPSGGGSTFDSYTTQAAVGHWFTDRWAVQLGLPYTHKEFDDTSESGIGDATLIGLYRVFNRFAEGDVRRLDIYAGLKMPTGDSDLLKHEEESSGMSGGHGRILKHAGDDHGEPAVPAMDAGHGQHSMGHHLAPGSGSWDGIVGIKGLIKQNRWLGKAETQYNLRTEGDHDFEYGDEWSWRLGAHYYAWLTEAKSLTAGIEINGEWRDENKVDGTRQPGSDKSATYVGPAITFTLGDRLHLAGAIDLPVSDRDKGLSGAADYRTRLSAAWSF